MLDIHRDAHEATENGAAADDGKPGVVTSQPEALGCHVRCTYRTPEAVTPEVVDVTPEAVAYWVSVRTARGALGASRAAPPVRTQGGRLVP